MPHCGQAKRLPLAKSRWMSSRLAVASKSLFVTTHGGSMPSAIRNKSVSRTQYLLCSGFATSHHSSGALPPNPRDT